MFMSRWNRLSNLNRRSIQVGFSTVGPTITTYLGVNLLGDGHWLIWKTWPEFANAFLYGTLSFAFLAILVSVLVKGLNWAIHSVHQAGRNEGFTEHQAQAISEGRKEGMEMALAELSRLAVTDETKTLLRQVADNNDLNVAAIVGRFTGTAQVTLSSPWDTLSKRMADVTAELRQRTSNEDFDGQVDRLLRAAVGVAVSELQKELDRRRELGNL